MDIAKFTTHRISRHLSLGSVSDSTKRVLRYPGLLWGSPGGGGAEWMSGGLVSSPFLDTESFPRGVSPRPGPENGKLWPTGQTPVFANETLWDHSYLLSFAVYTSTADRL